jgi:hypothetical protein
VPTLYELGKLSMNHHELGMIREDGTVDVWCYGHQPTTNDIADRATHQSLNRPRYRFAVQLIAGRFEVYDLHTLKRVSWGTDYTIGLPVVTHENLDAALMAAVLLT